MELRLRPQTPDCVILLASTRGGLSLPRSAPLQDRFEAAPCFSRAIVQGLG